nr:type II secretion system protein [uncultured Campylobacter sp.]
MKKAFTLIELVFVMIVLGILTFTLWPKKEPTQALEAARQIVAHIRYTQHLALNDDKFATHTDTGGTGDNIAKDWYKRMWRITFSNTAAVSGCKSGGWRYAVYQNISRGLSDRGQPNGAAEAARNPANGKALSACYSGLSQNTSDELNLQQTYKITNIDFSDFATDSRIQGIIFDELGRAYPNGEFKQAYDNGKNFKLGRDNSYGRIKLSAKDRSKANILVFSETGYACVENVDLGCQPPTTP